jgi:hypothetical protein
LLEDRRQAATAAALFTLLPPFPGYLPVAYPEIVVSCVLLSGLAWVVTVTGTPRAVVAGILFGLGALFRESLLLALPLYLVRIPRRGWLRGFLPGAAVTLVLLAPLSRDRAVHPNALYPAVFEEAWRSDAPASHLAAALWRNAAANRLASGRPLSMLGAVLVFLPRRRPAPLPLARPRPAARGHAASLLLLTGAALSLRDRERGGAGVSACACPGPGAGLILATLLLFPRDGCGSRA